MNIRELDRTDADYEILAHLATAIWPENPQVASSIRYSDETLDPKYVRRRFCAEVDGRAVGYALCHHMVMIYDPHWFWINGGVLPPYRSRGIGGAIYEHILAQMAVYQPTKLFAGTREDRPQAIRFLEKRGFEETMRDWESRLDTTDYDFSPFAGIEDRVRVRGIEIKTHRQLVAQDPDCLRKLYELEWALEQEVPAPEPPTPVAYELWLKHRSEAHPNFLPDGYFVAVQGDDYVGISDVRQDPASDNLHVGLTGVLRDYRRQGLATALKLRTIVYAQACGNRTIITWNEQNNPMYLLNVKLGFVAQPAEITYRKHL